MDLPSFVSIKTFLFVVLVMGSEAMAETNDPINEAFSFELDGAAGDLADAMVLARSSSDEFFECIEDPKRNQDAFMVMVRAGDVTRWLAPVQLIDGRLVVSPGGTAEERVIEHDDVLDWGFADNGMLVGGHTIKAIHGRLNKEDQHFLQEGLPFLIVPQSFDFRAPRILLMRSIGYGDANRVEDLCRRFDLANTRVPVVSRTAFWFKWEESFPLHYAVQYGTVDVVRRLLDGGAEVDRGDEFNNSPLLVAIYWGKKDAARLLVNRGADVNWANEKGWTPLIAASYTNSLDVAKLLIERGARVSDLLNDGSSVLHQAKDNAELVDFLIEQGADVFHLDNEGDTALHNAATNGFLQLAERLIHHGAPLRQKNAKGKTPIDLALENGRFWGYKYETDQKSGGQVFVERMVEAEKRRSN